MLRSLLRGAVLIATATIAAAQRPVVFVHGFASNAGTWDYTRYHLNLPNQTFATTTLFIQPVQHQAEDVRDYMGNQGLLAGGPAALIVGHSMGGIISRHVSRLTPVAGILTIGSPHRGAHAAIADGWLQQRMWEMEGAAAAIAVGMDCTLWDYSVWGSCPFWGRHYWQWSALAIGAMYGVSAFLDANHTSVGDLAPGSAELNWLNATVGDEPVYRQSIGVSLPELAYFGGPLALFEDPLAAFQDGMHFVEQGYWMMEDAAFIFESLFDDHSYFFEKGAGAAGLITMGMILTGFGIDYTYNFVGGAPHDGFIATEDELYPDGAHTNLLCCAAHTQETTFGLPFIQSWIIGAP